MLIALLSTFKCTDWRLLVNAIVMYGQSSFLRPESSLIITNTSGSTFYDSDRSIVYIISGSRNDNNNASNNDDLYRPTITCFM